MRISKRQFGTAAILDLHGPLIGQQAHDQLARAMEPHLQSGREVIVINLTKVPDADGDAFYALAKADRALRRSRGALRVALPETGPRSLMLRRVPALFDCFDSVEDALADIRASMGRGEGSRFFALRWQAWVEQARRSLCPRAGPRHEVGTD
jgi:STAS domain